ncbi:hypothetical protein [Pseudoalteromonas luteoviolacea]|uniref:Uncharacterized protein n=1 Tax=Pseudoalteromonas luteoviolacea S4054 TaxID=1129367 RepID=A0A0F6A973_9GAMM|nr:hypothetical protein [Pseudoalteromonas luteoviolacea]KKE82386.1 hypothetical protein N479_02050 [Pseudoalteromonas luteoviolacea S4054]KZN78012.1 hypothetical protein N481_04060 [Pseudoalteromonas luteoviolacea S4047-1]
MKKLSITKKKLIKLTGNTLNQQATKNVYGGGDNDGENSKNSWCSGPALTRENQIINNN